MAWIESHQTLAKHRKTLRAAGRLSVDRATLIGHLHLLWWWGLDNVPSDGNLGDITDYELAEAAEWRGDPTEFVAALTEAGFIDERDGERRLHDWYDYAGKLLDKREKERERSRQRRTNNQRSTNGRPADGTTVDRAKLRGTVPNRTVPNHTQPEREKESRRDDVREDSAPTDSLALSLPDSEIPPDPTPTQQVMAHYHERIGMIGPAQFDKLRIWVEEHGMPADLVCYAIDIAADQAERPGVAYIEGVLRNWYNDGVRTLAAASDRASPGRVDPDAIRRDMDAALARIGWRDDDDES